MVEIKGWFYDPLDLIEWGYIIRRLEENGIDINDLEEA